MQNGGGNLNERTSDREDDDKHSDTSLERHRNSGSLENRVTNKEHRRQPDKRPRRDHPHTHSSGMSPEYWAHVLAVQPCREIVCCADGGDIDQDALPRWASVPEQLVVDVRLTDHLSVH